MRDKNKIVIGSRGSKLALWQAGRAKTLLLNNNPGLEVEIKIIKTKGDIITDVPLAKIGDEGLFTKAIEDELLAGKIDVGIHSCKDLPTELSRGLKIASYPERESAEDAWISASGKKFNEIKSGAVIGTSSLRRRAFLKRMRDDLEFIDLRGNVDTRMRKLKEGNMDAMLMALAAIKRMNLEEHVADIFDSDFLLPAVGQGALALEMRENDAREAFVKKTDNKEIRFCVEAERSFLKNVQGGCQVPVGCKSSYTNGILILKAAISSLNGKDSVEGEISGNPKESEYLGKKLAEQLLNKGGRNILSKIRSKNA